MGRMAQATLVAVTAATVAGIAFIHEGRVQWAGTVPEMHAATDPVLTRFVRANEYTIGTPSDTA